ncbi:hypothetical protein VTN31DRAFT_2044 [Thermomyces dupontii]|uniref:uncharacterized protein n=1 Tax=Talaromyces thermophilus TaxID=28565 RepID=UPI00374458DA
MSLATLAALLLNAVAVQAKLPLAPSDLKARLQEDNDITFDPLGVAAVLHNPRAQASAARLYTQHDRDLFIWPHTMMIGATLVPLQVLVEHMTATFSSIHPAITLCTKGTVNLNVVSNMVFKELPLDFSNSWLEDIIAFKSSSNPNNDFMLVHIPHGTPQMGPVSWKVSIGRISLHLISVITGAMLAACIVLSILTSDIWSVTLFFFYGTHWLAGVTISMTTIVAVHQPERPIPVDSTTRYAIYQRPAGGTVVFKGRQDDMEKWGRRTWEFVPTFTNKCLHWLWITTGTLAALGSVACMVNMRGYMQLAFLGILVYSSLAEIVATRIARMIREETHLPARSFPVLDNNTRTRGIIRATIEAHRTIRLTNLDWVALNRLPDFQIFKDMQEMLKRINEFQEDVEVGNEPHPRSEVLQHPRVKDAMSDFLAAHAHNFPGKLAERIVDETREALLVWSRFLDSIALEDSADMKANSV